MAKVDFALIGDSHAGAIGRAARARDLRFHGGPLASARSFYSDFFEAGPDGLRFTDAEVQEMHAQLCALLEIPTLSQVQVPLISTIGSGFHVPATGALWSSFVRPDGGFEAGFVGSDLCAAICDRMLGPMLGFHALLIGHGIGVRFVLPPQRVPDTSNALIQTLIQTRAVAALTDLGCTIIDMRASTCDAQGRQLPA